MDKLGDRHNQGKPRMDLIPWSEIHVTDFRTPVALMEPALQAWWCAAPIKLETSIPRVELLGIGGCLAQGAAKYAERNWEQGQRFSTCFAAAMRHALRAQAGERLDPESGQPHESHFWCNVMFLVVFTARGRVDLDDRPPADPGMAKKLADARGVQTGVDFNNALNLGVKGQA